MYKMISSMRQLNTCLCNETCFAGRVLRVTVELERLSSLFTPLLYLMRVRVSTVAPLPQVKAWFPVEVNARNSPGTVDSLKRELCTKIEVLRRSRVQSSGIALFLDDYELLGETSLDVLKDGDTIWYVVTIFVVSFRSDVTQCPPQGGLFKTQV